MDSMTVSMSEACATLRVSARTISRLIEAGELTAEREGNGPTSPLKINAESIRAYLSRQTTGTPALTAIPKLYTLREVAEQTGFALRTLQQDCRADRIAHIRRGRERVMTAEQIQQLLDQHTRTPKTETDAELKKTTAESELRRLAARTARRARS